MFWRCSPWLVVSVLACAAAYGGESRRGPEGAQDPEIYFTPFSHLDFFWGGTREECLARGNGIIAQAIRLARQSPEFRFLLEDNVFVSNYVETHPGSREVEDLKRLVQAGRIEIAPKWAAIFQGLPDGEVHARNMAIGKRYARDVFGVDPQVAHLGDLPDYTPQFPQVLKQARVPFMVMTRMGPADKSLFHWKAPDGSRALVWNTLKGYGWGTFLSSQTQLDEQKLERFRKDLADVRRTTDGPILMNWGTDLWSPPGDLVEKVGRFRELSGSRLVISTPSQFFRRAARNPAIPELSGEIPSSWPNVVSSLAHMWPQIIPATNTLLGGGEVRDDELRPGLRGIPAARTRFSLEEADRVDGPQPRRPGGRDRRRAEDRLHAACLARGRRDPPRHVAQHRRARAGSDCQQFPDRGLQPAGLEPGRRGQDAPDALRRGFARRPGDFQEGDAAGGRDGQRVPFHVEQYSENISRALELVFVARGVPSLGYKTYYLVAAEKPDEFPKTAATSTRRREGPSRAAPAAGQRRAGERVLPSDRGPGHRSGDARRQGPEPRRLPGHGGGGPRGAGRQLHRHRAAQRPDDLLHGG